MEVRESPTRETYVRDGRKPGRAVKLLLFRYTMGRGRGGKRELLMTLAPNEELARLWIDRYGPGTYRLEFRDDRNWITSASTVKRMELGGQLDVHARATLRRLFPRPKPSTLTPQEYDRSCGWGRVPNPSVLERHGIRKPPPMRP